MSTLSPEASLVAYYAQRAQQYERVYHKPERQDDLRRLREIVRTAIIGKRVLEVACGTGYWTELVAPVVEHLVGVDVNEEVLALARAKHVPAGKVTFRRGDAFDLPDLAGQFNAALCGFWWSHVPKSRLIPFLRGLHRKLEPGALVLVFDNAYVGGSSTPLSRVDSDGNPVSCGDEEGNTYQQRVLDDGSTHQIVKNFPTAHELHATVNGLGQNVKIQWLTYYWVLSYTVQNGDCRE
ncbi:MAG TPA: methyltransferase domain-containing protein [Candidatus Dormibacteraeota bacterium]|nr:methyltransferase domain-containing protein [Candidatus Dormibacteraeota bacterium]